MRYKITKSSNADTRTATSETKKDLHLDTLKHLKDVQSLMTLVAIQLQKQGIKHDHTKIDHLDEFYHDWKEGSDGFINKEWYQRHITEEKHHSSSFLHEDFNLLDLLEEIVDKVCAGKGRSGEINKGYFNYSNETLQLAVENTIILLDNMTKIK